MKPESKNTLKEFALTAVTAIGILVLIGTGAGCLNYASITEQRFYTFVGSIYFVLLISLVFYIARYFDKLK